MYTEKHSTVFERSKQRRLKLQLEKLKATVGMCFRIKDGLARVYDVPQIESHKIGDDINPYQIPVIDMPFGGATLPMPE